MGTLRQTQQYGYPQTTNTAVLDTLQTNKHSCMITLRQIHQYEYHQTNRGTLRQAFTAV